MINKVILVGRTTKDLELKKTLNGKSVTSFTLACKRNKDETDFFNCVAWDKLADTISKYVHKGSLIGIVGRLQTRSYDDKDGKKVWITEVIAENVDFMDTKVKESNSHSYGIDAIDIDDSDLSF